MADDKLKDAERYIQACLSEDDVPESDLDALESLLAEDSDAAKEIAMQLLDEGMIRSWFRSEADPSFIDAVKRRLQLRFNDAGFVEAAMERIQDTLDATPGSTGETVRETPPSKSNVMKYLFVPIAAALLYVLLAYHGQLAELLAGDKAVSPVLARVSGSAEADVELDKGVRLKPGTALRTAEDGGLELRYEDGSSVLVQASTKLTIAKGKGRKLLKLSKGAIRLELTAQDPELIVETPLCRILIEKADALILVNGSAEELAVISGAASIRRLDKKDESPSVSAGRRAIIPKDGGPIRVEEVK